MFRGPQRDEKRALRANVYKRRLSEQHFLSKCDLISFFRCQYKLNLWQNSLKVLFFSPFESHASHINTTSGPYAAACLWPLVWSVFQGLKLNLGKSSKMIIGSILTIFEVSSIFWVAGTLTKTGLSLKSNHQIKLSLSKSLKHTVHVCIISPTSCNGC